MIRSAFLYIHKLLPAKIVFKLTLLLIFLSATIGVGIFIINERNASRYMEQTLRPNIQQHTVYIVKDIYKRLCVNKCTSKPVHKDPHSASNYIHDLSNRLNVDIIVQNAKGFLSTNEKIEEDFFNSTINAVSKRRFRKKNEHDIRRNKASKHKPRLVPIRDRYNWNTIAQNQLGLQNSSFSSFQHDKKHHIIISSQGNQNIAVIYRKTLVPLSLINSFHLALWCLLLAAISFIILLYTMRPINALKKGVARIEAGDFSTEIPQTSQDELGSLVRSFNTMAKGIQQKIEEKEQLLSDVSHELRTPLARMKVALELITNSRTKKLIREDIDEQESIITVLLESARLSNSGLTPDKEKSDIIQLIASCIDYQKTYKDTKTLKFRHTDKQLFISLDSQLILRVISNLINNAVKHSNPKAVIVIECTANDTEVFVTVTNRGPNIPLDLQQKVFEPFVRQDISRSKSTGGYGLGLSLCRKIIEAHNGRIFIDPAFTKGVKITFTIPNA